MEGEDGNGDPPILKREPTRSPSPPPLSPIHSDINSKIEEKPPSLLHHRDEERDDPSPPIEAKDGLEIASQQGVAAEGELETTTKEEGRSRAVQNPSGSLLQDVMDRFSEKLETIRPLEKDLPLNSTSNQSLEKKLPLTCSVSQSLQSHADAHLSEIITTVLHAGSDSDYNLSELFHRHDNNEAKSPNTRSRRRQEVLANMTTSPDHASTRRQTLQIKRELAMLDLPYCRRKLSLAKRVRLKDGKNVTSPPSSSSDTTPVKEESEREIEIQEMKGVCQEQEMVKIGEEEETVSAKVGEDRITEDREMESVTKVQGGKVDEGPKMEKGREDGGIVKIRREEGNMLTTEERNEIKEEIETLKVTEEIEFERIKEEGAREMATEEEEQVASDTPVPTTGPQNKSYKPDAQDKVLGYSNACNKGGDSRHLENKRSQKDTPLGQTCDSTLARGKDHPCQVRGRRKASFPSQKCNSREAGRSRRNIIPPQRFSSYVTEPRKMYFAACFSESIFNLRTPKDKVLKASGSDPCSIDSDVRDTPLELKEALPDTPDLQGEPAFESMPEEQFGTSNCEAKDQSQVIQVMVATTEKSPSKHSSQNRTDVRDSAAKPYGRLRSCQTKLHDSESETASRTPQKCSKSGNHSSSVNCVQSHPNPQTQYTSPIKLMYVSPVMDEGGVRYSLKSAASGSSGQGEETFDPCEESSWAGTQKTSPCNEDATSPPKCIFSPRKSATSSPKSPSTPPKSDSTPPKSATSPPKSTSSSPKIGPKRLGESTPPKRGISTENQRTPGSLKGGCEKQNDSVPFHELTPPKRRPGRPKKLGPQLEKKVKRPIGRPRKQKGLDVKGANAENVKAVLGPDMEEKANKNLKITVVYGRSRRNKRLVSEGCGQLQTELHEPRQAGDRNGDLSNLTQNSQAFAGSVKASSSEWSEEFDFVRPVKDRESAFHSSSNIKCQKLQGAVPMRKPGRPAKVKISGISVTVTTVSPRQRKIQINKDARQSPETLNRKRALLPEFKSAKEPWTISVPSSNDSSQTEGRVEEKEEGKDKQPDRPVAVRHSVRVRKPSIYLLHSVATSRSYSHSTALLRRSRQLLLNKASNLRRREEAQGGVEVSGERRQLLGQRRKQVCHDLSQVAGVSVNSIFPPGETLKWWAPSAEEDTLNQELARRIRLVSDTWVSDTIENQEEVGFKPTFDKKGNGSFSKRSKHSSVVRMLFDCPPRKPRSCSMQQLCSWFMQTTETQSLAIVKKASSRNPYELMHYPRSTNRGSVCPSPQAERLRKHIKKFAKTVPKSPSQHQQAQERLWKKATSLTGNTKRQLFTQRFSPGSLNQGAPWWRGRALGKYSTTLLRAKARFLTRSEREKWPKRQRNNQREMLRWRLAVSSLPGHIITSLQPRHTAFSRLAAGHLYCLENNYTTSPADHTQEPMDVPKEQRLSSKAWSPETLKECRVFLKKINSPDNESTAEEWDSCTVTLDDGSPSASRLEERELEGDIKAVKMERRKKRRRKRTASKVSESSTSKVSQEQDGVPSERQNGKWKSPGDVSSDPPQPPPAKMLRQSRVRGLTGPRWCDFVFGNHIYKLFLLFFKHTQNYLSFFYLFSVSNYQRAKSLCFLFFLIGN